MADENQVVGTDRILTALKYTDGDQEKARLMAEGVLTDIVIVKGRFSVPEADLYAVFIVFANVENNSILNLSITLTGKDVFAATDIRSDWKSFYRFITENEISSNIDSADIKAHLAESIAGYDIYPDIQGLDAASVAQTFEEILRKFYSLNSLVCETEFEKTSQLDIAESNIEFVEKRTVAPAPAAGEKNEFEIGADFVVPGKVIVSPVRGKYINDLEPGDMIKIILTNNDPVSQRVARAYNAIGEKGGYLPIHGKYRGKILAEKGYYLYCLIAKKIMAKIAEEENVKIEIENPGAKQELGSKQPETSLFMYVILLVVLMFISVVVIYAIL